VWQLWPPHPELSRKNQESRNNQEGFLEKEITMDGNTPVISQELIMDTTSFDEVQIQMRPIWIGKQLLIEVVLEDIVTKKKMVTQALVNLGCTQMHVNEEFARSQGWLLKRIKNPIPIKYADRTVTETSKIWYHTNLRIKTAGKMVLTRALVTHLKSFKVFLGFDWLQSVNPIVNWREQMVKVLNKEVPLPMRSMEEVYPHYTQLYPWVFSEEAFKDLLLRRKWDHIIELKEGHKPLRG
jgi:hypothetical protein